MKGATTIENAAFPRAKAFPSLGLSRRLALQALANMRRGHLQIELPDGSVHQSGTAGTTPHAMIRVIDDRFFRRCVLFGDIGFGEAYTDGLWETPDLTSVVSWFIHNLDSSPLKSDRKRCFSAINVLEMLNRLGHLLRENTKLMSRQNIAEHYDLGNDFYRLWLDETMTYSSALFTSETTSLAEAQRAKYDALCRRLRLHESDHVLEIGTGWGGFCSHAARNYGCRITSVTISKEQFHYATDRMKKEGLSDRVKVEFSDYRDVAGQFSKIASIEMLEAVGHRYLPAFFSQCNKLLARDGLLGLQFITIPDSKYDALRRHVDWIQKHIFPGSLLLSIGRIHDVMRKTGDLSLHSLNDFGLSYARTLATWRDRFNAAVNQVRSLGFDDRFIRKWNYYLSYCEAAFAMRNISVVQGVFTRPCNPALRML